MKEFWLNITTPDGPRFDGMVVRLSARAVDGDIGILADHIPLVTALKPGECRVQLPDGTTRTADISGGLLTVTKKKVHLLSASCAWRDEVGKEAALEEEE